MTASLSDSLDDDEEVVDEEPVPLLGLEPLPLLLPPPPLLLIVATLVSDDEELGHLDLFFFWAFNEETTDLDDLLLFFSLSAFSFLVGGSP